MADMLWKHCTLFILKILVQMFGGLRGKEKLGMMLSPYYAYGLLSAADDARKMGITAIWAIEFGVASGRGLTNLVGLSNEIERVTGVKIRIAGFDTGTGMPPSDDYRDHPEKYREGDYPMIDPEALRSRLPNKAELILGDIAETIESFTSRIERGSPVGFISIDVDTYSGSMSALKLFDAVDPEKYLPMVYSYFSDSGSRSHFNKFAGELLSIDHFNAQSQMRKIDIDRGIRNKHRRLGWQSWFDRSFITHIFDHPWRTNRVKRDPKLL
jgi:hypothetical protein